MTCTLSPHFSNNLKLCRALIATPWRSLDWGKKPFSSLRNRSKFKPTFALYRAACTTGILRTSSTFQGKDDRYEGVTVLSENEPCKAEELLEKLKNSLELWKSLKKRGVWFRVHTNQSDWVPILVKYGFKYHHAKGDYAMLYLWLSSAENNNIPTYAHTMIGVGAVVVNSQDQVLVVKEKYQFYNRPFWKLPGGHVEPGEDLVDAALREVFEETGIKCEFQSILTLRQGHNGIFGCSDIYVVVNLKALNEDIKKCDREIAECQWMNIEDYLSHPHIHELNRSEGLCLCNIQAVYSPFVAVAMASSLTESFQGKEDHYQGITVHSGKEPCKAEVFANKLQNSLELWRCQKKRSVWFRVHLDHSDWVPILAKNGFKYHHAKGDYVMMYKWLPVEESDNVPNFAHTMIGVGAVVENDQNQILVVKEKYFYKKPLWKLPGGYVEPGENLVDAALREVLEETGIPTMFESVLTFRQAHHLMFDCSDIYMVLHLKALSQDIKKCDREISDCQWMDIEEYLTHPDIHELNRYFVSKLLHHKKHNLKIDCHYGIHQIVNKPFTVYSVFKADDWEEYQKTPFSSIPLTTDLH